MKKLWLEVLAAASKRQGTWQAEPFIVRRMLTGALSWTVTWYRRSGVADLGWT